jgi:hypothetical protein
MEKRDAMEKIYVIRSDKEEEGSPGGSWKKIGDGQESAKNEKSGE